jgi:DNA-binding CsgD family transcriptional regulator
MITPEEYKYLSYVLSCATNYTVARGEQISFPTVKHKQLEQKLEVIVNRCYK